MADEGKLRKKADRGKTAAELLENPIIKETLDQMEQELLRGWEETGAPDVQTREDAWRMYQTCKRFRGILKKIVIDGEDARKTLWRDRQEDNHGGQ